MSEWTNVSKAPPPKVGKFLFSYEYGVGLGEWGVCRENIYPHGEYTTYKYILCLWPSESRDVGHMEFTELHMIELEMCWMPLPEKNTSCQ